MPIGTLETPANVVVGQAACFIAPANTALPDISLTALVSGTPDPFDITPWTYARLTSSGGALTGGTFTITYTFNGVAYTTSSLTAATVTAAQVDTALTAAMAALGVGANDIVTSGGPVSANATPISISLSEAYVGGTWTITPSTITGGTLAISASLWTPVGATDQGWTWASNKTTQDITIEEQSTPVYRTVNSQIITVEGALSEDISRTLQAVYNMTNAYTANSSGHAGFETLTLTDSVLQYAVALVMANQLGFPRWLYIPAATCLGNASGVFRRATAKRMYTATFSSICPTSSIILENVLQRGS
jgi:hypothetical protein